MISWLRCPFLKRQLLVENPAGLTNLGQVPAVLRACTSYDPKLIEGHLRRLGVFTMLERP